MIERSKRSSWPAGYVIVPVALLVGLLQILIPSASIGWLEGALQQASASQASAPKTSASQNSEAQLAALQAAAVQAAAADAIAEKRHPLPPPQPEPSHEIGPAPTPALSNEIGPGPSDEIGSTGPAPEVRASARPAPPAEVPIRVFIHHSDSPADTEPALRLAAYLQAQGFDVAGVRTVGASIERPSVRYFFDHDRPGSRRLVEVIGSFFAEAPDLAPEAASDFSHFSPKPRLGNVEVWLPGDRRSRKTAAAS